MRKYCFLLFFALLAHAEVCDSRAFQGTYGFSLTGTTTIGGPSRPVATIGRLVLDDAGNLTGVSSAAFTGLVLGNPVTGKYEALSDCSATWSLQDDSGAYQHFAGRMSADAGRVSFRQTDPGGAGNGTLVRTMSACSESSLAGEFRLTLSGNTVDVDSGVVSGRVSFSGLLLADGAGGISIAVPDQQARVAGTYHVQDDCFLDLSLELPVEGKENAATHFRAILADKGLEVLGVQRDPGTVVALRLVSNQHPAR